MVLIAISRNCEFCSKILFTLRKNIYLYRKIGNNEVRTVVTREDVTGHIRHHTNKTVCMVNGVRSAAGLRSDFVQSFSFVFLTNF
jgi:hypothetical protein